MMRGESCGMHPPEVMARPDKQKPCGRKDKNVEVEDHGNGFMFVGTTDIAQARRLLPQYVGKKQAKRMVFAARTWYEGRAHGVWLTAAPSQVWEGAKDALGRPIREWGTAR